MVLGVACCGGFRSVDIVQNNYLKMVPPSFALAPLSLRAAVMSDVVQVRAGTSNLGMVVYVPCRVERGVVTGNVGRDPQPLEGSLEQ